MPSQDSAEFFNELKEWSERKLKILSNYIDPFVKILGSRTAVDTVYYIDGFAGAGVYKGGEHGSPVRAAELAQKYQQEKKHYRLACINVEASRDNFENLQTNTAQFGNLVINLQGTFIKNIDTILQKSAGRPALCFLDPFGVKGIDWSALKRLIHRGNPTDLWIRFDYSMVRRLDGFYGGGDPTSLKNFATLCQTYGIADQNKLHAQLSGNSAEERINKAVNLYVELVAKEFASTRGKGFAAAYPIKSIEGQNKYFLIFATSHPRGAILASEVVNSAEESYQRELEEYQSQQMRQLSLFFSPEPTKEEIFQDKVNRLKESIWTNCRGQQLNGTEIYETIISEWFGKIRSKHMTKALNELREEGKIPYASGASSNYRTVFKFSS